jgi:hypothetical protein
LLHNTRKLAQQTAELQGQKYNVNIDAKTAAHKFQMGQKVWLSDTTSIGKNAKLTPKWISPFQIIDLNDNSAKLKDGKIKIVNVTSIKPYLEEPRKCLSEDDSHSSQRDQHLSQDAPCLSKDSTNGCPNRPVTRALQKLIDCSHAHLVYSG